MPCVQGIKSFIQQHPASHLFRALETPPGSCLTQPVLLLEEPLLKRGAKSGASNVKKKKRSEPSFLLDFWL